MPAPPNEHNIHYNQCTVDSKSKAVHYSYDGQLAMECYVDISEKDDDAKLRERLKFYTSFQIKYLQQDVLGQMLGAGARQTYPKLAKEADINGGHKKHSPSLERNY
jgi:hypothetical protein